MEDEGVFMLKIKTTLLSLLMTLSCIITTVHADNILNSDSKQGIEKAQLPITYQMKIVYIYEGDKPEAIIVVGNAGFKSVASLKNWAMNLPSGTIIEFDTTCKHIENEPVVIFDKEMDDFKDFCKQRNINFVIHPAG
jgi:hypothetical protein